MMSGVPLETCWAFSKLWSNKFYYKLHLVGISTDSLLCSSWCLISPSVIWESLLNIWAVQIMKLPIMEHPVASWYFLLLGSKCSRNILQLSSDVTVKRDFCTCVELRPFSNLDMCQDRSLQYWLKYQGRASKALSCTNTSRVCSCEWIACSGVHFKSFKWCIWSAVFKWTQGNNARCEVMT